MIGYTPTTWWLGYDRVSGLSSMTAGAPASPINYKGGKEGSLMPENTQAEYVTIHALENGVQIIGLTRGGETRLLHTEKIDKGEVYIAQFTETVAAIKVRGKAKIYTKHGVVDTTITE